MAKILYYVSGHGYGHISRSYEITKELLQNENHSITIVSGRIDFIQETHPRLERRKISVDVGIYQKDSLSLDVKKTAIALKEFEDHKNDILKNELEFIRQNDFDMILSDCASLPFVMGAEMGIPAVFIGNFTWDFIYRHYNSEDPYFGVIAHIMQVEYSFATIAIQLPFSCPIEGFQKIYPVGLVGRKPKLTKEEAKQKYRMKEGEVHFLLSFGAYGLEGQNWEWRKMPSHWKLYTSGTPGANPDFVIHLDTDHYPDLVTAVDYVVTKPGYGIISECIFADTPILYTERGNFAEYPFLTQGLEESIPSAYLSRKDLLEFRWFEAIEKIQSEKRSNKRWIGSREGAKEVVEILQQYIS